MPFPVGDANVVEFTSGNDTAAIKGSFWNRLKNRASIDASRNQLSLRSIKIFVVSHDQGTFTATRFAPHKAQGQ